MVSANLCSNTRLYSLSPSCCLMRSSTFGRRGASAFRGIAIAPATRKASNLWNPFSNKSSYETSNIFPYSCDASSFAFINSWATRSSWTSASDSSKPSIQVCSSWGLKILKRSLCPPSFKALATDDNAFAAYSAVRKVQGQTAKHTKYATFWGASSQECLIALQFSEI